MRKLLIAASLTIFLANGIMSAARAQTTPAASAPPATAPATGGKTPVRVKVGLFSPTDNATQKATKNISLFGGLTYDLSKKTAASSMLSGYMDVTGDDGRGKDGDGLHSRYFALGIGPQMRRYMNASHKIYIGVGLGLYVVQAERESIVNRSIVSKESTSIKPGGKLFGGFEFNSGIFTELSYTGVGKQNGLNASGVGLALGIRI